MAYKVNEERGGDLSADPWQFVEGWQGQGSDAED